MRRRSGAARASTRPPACAVYNSRFEQEIQPKQDRLNIFGRGTLQVFPSLQAYLELGYFQTKTKANGTLGGNNDSGVFNPADPANPIVHGLMILPAGHPDNTFGVDRTLAYAPAELGGRDQVTKNEVFRHRPGPPGYRVGLGLRRRRRIHQGSPGEHEHGLHPIRRHASRAQQRHLPDQQSRTRPRRQSWLRSRLT